MRPRVWHGGGCARAVLHALMRSADFAVLVTTGPPTAYASARASPSGARCGSLGSQCAKTKTRRPHHVRVLVPASPCSCSLPCSCTGRSVLTEWGARVPSQRPYVLYAALRVARTSIPAIHSRNSAVHMLCICCAHAVPRLRTRHPYRPHASARYVLTPIVWYLRVVFKSQAS